MSGALTWVLEKLIFEDEHARLAKAVEDAGNAVLWWKDEWLEGFRVPDLSEQTVMFHGSLGCAARISELGWEPGAFCNTPAFYCSAWYEQAKTWLAHDAWAFTTVQNLVDNPDSVLGLLEIAGAFFVRPDSPLKPFSGRVLTREKLSLHALDHGFYYDDENLPIVIAPAREVGEEWRLVIADSRVVASSGYVADGRNETGSAAPEGVQELANIIAARLPAPDPVYVMDLGIVDEELKLMELNPFSGADLYSCERASIVSAVQQASKKNRERSA